MAIPAAPEENMLPLKLVLVPALIGLVSLVGRRWGPGVSGLLVGLPWTSGPVLLFLAVERGAAFAAEAAAGVLGGVVSLVAFCLAYAGTARRLGWPGCATLAALVYLAVTFALLEVRLPVAVSFAMVTVVLAAAQALMPRGSAGRRRVRPDRWDLPLRMVTATAIVVALTGFAAVLGARLSGLLAPFPVYAAVLAVFAHRGDGAGAALATLHGVVRGSFSFAVFFLVAAVGIGPLGIAPTFIAAGASAVSLHVILLDAQRRTAVVRAASPPGS